jgi:hypothetical protein
MNIEKIINKLKKGGLVREKCRERKSM